MFQSNFSATGLKLQEEKPRTHRHTKADMVQTIQLCKQAILNKTSIPSGPFGNIPANLWIQTCNWTSQILRTLSLEKLMSWPLALLNWTCMTAAIWPLNTYNNIPTHLYNSSYITPTKANLKKMQLSQSADCVFWNETEVLNE